MAGFVEGNVALLRSFATGVGILGKLPRKMWTASPPCTFEVPCAVRAEYEAELGKIRSFFEKLPRQRSAQSTLALLIFHRILWILAAASQQLGVFMVVGSLQFVIAPYSFAVGIMGGIMYFFTNCLGHLVTALLLFPLPLPDVSLELSNSFIGIFLSVDFAFNCYCAFVHTTVGTPKRFSPKDTVWHMCYGTFNTKTYFLVVFLFCRGTKFNLFWILLDAALGLGALVNNWVQRTVLSWELLFYHVHRLQHLPVVYEQAHKAHHFLQDTMAFDGHVFSGSGFPEEWFLMTYDIFAMLVLGVPPPALTWRMIPYQIANKDGHQRKERDFEGEQWHEDHHVVHRANIGFSRPLFDMYFETCKGEGRFVHMGSATYTKNEVSASTIRFEVQATGRPGSGLANSGQPLPGWQKKIHSKVSPSVERFLSAKAKP